MTREELKAHCQRQIESCEMWAKHKGEEPHGKVYEEHKLILELLEQEPRKGHWIEEKNDYGEVTGWHCDKCYEDSGFTTTCKWDFCPNCGAKMEEEVEK